MAGSIYITGDCHGDFRKFSTKLFPEQREMDKDDFVIICGDFGGIWDFGTESRSEKYWLDWLDDKTYTTLFVDGNHENFDRLNSYPVKMWHGGKVHEIRESVIHLMRGQVFEIAGKKIFSFGGASSHDVTDGILDMEAPNFISMKKWLDTIGGLYRINHISWWEQELASEAEMAEGIENVKRAGCEVDYIITHCCATDTQERMGGGGLYKSDKETDYLNQIKKLVKYGKWYFGHYHMDRNISDNETLLYDAILKAGDELPDL